MKKDKTIRNIVFWFVDSLMGGKRRKHIEEIQYSIENPSSQRTIEVKENNLNHLLTHAISTTPYYSMYLEWNSISDFPIINKNIIRNNYQLFRSKDFINKINFKVSTSGSTGTPFSIFQNKNKKYRNAADTIYFSEQAGYKVGYKIFYFRLWSAFKDKKSILKKGQNIVKVDVFSLAQEKTIKKIINQIKKSKSAISLLGYASAFEEICKYLDQGKSKGIKTKIKSIIAISERLNLILRNH